MTPRDAQIQSLFIEALDQPPAQVPAFLHRVCGDDVCLLAELSHLLEAACADTSELGRCAERFAIGTRAPAAGTQLGRYRLIDELGRGGMGIVWLAEEDYPRRHVALKLLHAMPTDAQRCPFEREAEWLARLDHPAIARLHAAGTWSDGHQKHACLALEYIDGQPITRAADHQHLDRRARLQLLLAVARGIEHAHQRGVLHRDLKPANVLVDAKGEPHIIDFGIARALTDDLEFTQITQPTSAYLGTVPYMSPEQCRGDRHAIDARSDVYALAVIGFELLSGSLPHGMPGANLPELMQRIALRPAARLSSVLADTSADLDAVFDRALALESADRYPSVSAFADDLERLIDDRPTLARPLGVIALTRRTVRRHRWRFAAAAAVTLLLLTSLLAVGMEHGRRRATERGLDLTLRVAGLAAADSPSLRLACADQISVQLDEGSIPIDLEIELRNLAGQVYLDADRPDAALPQHQRALDLSLEGDDDDAPATLRLVDVVYTELQMLKRHGEAEALLSRWFTPASSPRLLCPETADACRIALRKLRFQYQHARLLRSRGAFDEAIASLQSIQVRRLAVLRRLAKFQDLGVPPSSNPDLLLVERLLAHVLADRGDHAVAIAQIEATCTRVRALPTDVMDAPTAQSYERSRLRILASEPA